ncbi:MAG: type II toxin-antitoxin system HicA family toxin [Proteobacteria bacterium]|nr:type II toxin-antitoxin system HicA family toxin [Pseudomonadota bacterium]
MPSYNELIKQLKDAGCHKVKEKGSKQLWQSPAGQTFWVHYHGAKEIPPGTYHRILKEAGIK